MAEVIASLFEFVVCNNGIWERENCFGAAAFDERIRIFLDVVEDGSDCIIIEL